MYMFIHLHLFYTGRIRGLARPRLIETTLASLPYNEYTVLQIHIHMYQVICEARGEVYPPIQLVYTPCD